MRLFFKAGPLKLCVIHFVYDKHCFQYKANFVKDIKIIINISSEGQLPVFFEEPGSTSCMGSTSCVTLLEVDLEVDL